MLKYLYQLLAKLMSENICENNLEIIIQKRDIIFDIFKDHLKYDICSIDCIVEFTKDNCKTINNTKDTKPFIDEILKTIKSCEKNDKTDYFYKSKLMLSLQAFLIFHKDCIK